MGRALSASPNTTYDAVYLLAYATYAIGDLPVTGASLSRAFARLVPPGTPIDVGLTSLFEAHRVLRAGGTIDVTGTTGPLDFDLARGEAPVDLVILCVGAGASGKGVEAVESGIVYRAATGKLEGKIHCGE